jgi:F5/8 type C domain/Tectonin domain
MLFRLFMLRKPYSQRMFIMGSIIILLFLLLSWDQTTNLRAMLKHSLNDSSISIPLAFPTTNNLNPANNEESIDQLANNMLFNLQIRTQPEDQPTTLATCEKLPSPIISASGNDGNIPSNAIDANPDTRWSNLGSGSWIQIDFGSKKSICSVDIAWYRGDMRQNTFVISVSDDGSTFTPKHSDTSGGATKSPEKYILPADTEGRYVRVTVNGNTENDWASITEIAAFGDSAIGGGGGESPFPPQVTKAGPLYHTWQTSSGNAVWVAWSSLGGTLSSNPASITNADGKLEVFAIGDNGKALYHRAQTAAGGTTWSAWTSLGGTLDGSPAVARNTDGRLEVFAVGANGHALYHKWQTSAGGTTWSAWTSLGGVASSNPVVAVDSEGRLVVFVVSATGQLYYRAQTSADSSSWSAWTSLGGTIVGSPAAAINSDGRLEVFAVGTNDKSLYHRAQNSPGSSTWSAWTSLGGTIVGSPAAAINSDGRLEVFAVGTNDKSLYHRAQNSPGSRTWSAWTSLGGTLEGAPAVARNADGRLEAFAVGANGHALYHKWQTAPSGTTWSAWTSLGGNIANTNPSVSTNSNGRVETFVIGGGSSGGGGGDAGANDKFGIKKIYPTKPGGEEWYIDMNNQVNDKQFNDGGSTLTKNSDGSSYNVRTTSARLQAYPSSGYIPAQINTLNQQNLATKGYMQSPNDWKNVEITGYFRVNSYTSSTTNGPAHIELTARGGTHTSSKPCEGTSYHSNTYQTGRSKFEKELEHTAGYATNNPENPSATSSLQGRGWIGLKAVFYTSPLDGRVKLEQWIDGGDNTEPPQNNWQKLLEFADTGTNWAAPQNSCGGTLNQLITWGGPMIFFRWDNINDMDIRDFSVREITPPT